MLFSTNGIETVEHPYAKKKKKNSSVNFTFYTEKNLKTGHRCECKMIKILEKTVEKIFMTFCQAKSSQT